MVLPNLLFLVRQDPRRLHHGGVGPSDDRLFNDPLPHMDTGNVTAYFPILCVAWFLVELFVERLANDRFHVSVAIARLCRPLCK